MAKKNERFTRLPGKRYRDNQTGQIISNSVKRRIQTGVSPGTFAKQRREAGVKNPLARFNRLVDLRVEQQQKEHAELIRSLEREKKAELKPLIAALKADKITRGSVAKSPEMKAIMRDLKTKSKSATGRKAQALVELGLRERSWAMAVGDSPKASK